MGCDMSKDRAKHAVTYDGCFQLPQRKDDWWYVKVKSLRAFRRARQKNVRLWHEPSSCCPWKSHKRVRAKDVVVCYLLCWGPVVWSSRHYFVLADGKLYNTAWSSNRQGVILRVVGDREVGCLKNAVPTPPAADMVAAKGAWQERLLSELMAAACSPGRLPQILDIEALEELIRTESGC